VKKKFRHTQAFSAATAGGGHAPASNMVFIDLNIDLAAAGVPLGLDGGSVFIGA
jgi:hypothetical protein